MDYEVAIVGAGAAGVAAARRLHASGARAILLEASDRVGGRAWTLDIAGMPLDMGCGWLHSAARNPWVEIAERAGLHVDRSDSAWREQWRDLGFTPAEQEAAGRAFDTFQDAIEQHPPASDRASDAMPSGGEWNAYLDALSGYINGAPFDRISITDYLAYDHAAGEANWRVREGYGRLVAASLPPIALWLAAPVRRIARTRDGVRIESDRGAIEAGAAIVTVGTTALARGVIAFDHSADAHLHAAAQLPLGLADKLFLEIVGDAPFEDETHLLADPRSATSASFYIRPLGRPVIECFLGGTGAEEIERDGLAAGFATMTDELVRLVGSGVRAKLRALAGSAWCRTDWVNGSYSHALPGCAGARAMLASPLDERVLFAGEATHATDFSTAHGAYQSGVRAAEEALAAIWPRRE